MTCADFQSYADYMEVLEGCTFTDDDDDDGDDDGMDLPSIADLCASNLDDDAVSATLATCSITQCTDTTDGAGTTTAAAAATDDDASRSDGSDAIMATHIFAAALLVAALLF